MAIKKLASLGRIGFVIEGEFDYTKAYKKLSVVNVPSTGSVYTAKTDIPANTPITDDRWFKLIDGNSESSGIFISSLLFGQYENGNVATVATNLTKYCVIVQMMNDWEEGTQEYYDDNECIYIYNQTHLKYCKLNLDYDLYKGGNILICTINETSNNYEGIIIPIKNINDSIGRLDSKIDEKYLELKGDLDTLEGHHSDDVEHIQHDINLLETSIGNLNNKVGGRAIYISRYGYDSTSIRLDLPVGVDLDLTGGVIFKCFRTGYKRIVIAAENHSVSLEFDSPLQEGNVYVVYKTASGNNYRVHLLHEEHKVITSPAYVTKISDDEANSLMINGLSNIQNIYENYQYNFDCVNCEGNINLLNFLGVKNNNVIENATVINSNNFNKLYLTVRLRAIFHIANYYKHFETRGGNYKNPNPNIPNVGNGSYFSNQVTYPSNALDRHQLNDIPVCLPQFFNYGELELSALTIPVNSKFTIILLPNMNPVNGEVTLSTVGNCPYSIVIWFDDFSTIVSYNSGTIGTRTPFIQEATIAVDKVEKFVENNPEVVYMEII